MSNGQDQNPACNFCQKKRREVAKIIRNGTSHICDECIDLCATILQEEGIRSPYSPWQSSPKTPGKWWVSIAPKWRHLFSGWLFRCIVTKTGLIRIGDKTFRPECEGLQGAKWLSRELPADPFAKALG